ncbi:TPA: hypothetical protein HA265_08415, partial [Candidatus Woesearchaeota archaeon]|nr:hypothetical protein [Candidatus Woesearchaeota archaeon]
MAKGVRHLAIIASILFLVLISMPTVMAVQKTGHIVLLAVYNEGGKFTGSPADLQLEIKPGNGRVFIETIPLSKVDTQISTRFAEQIACQFAEAECDKYDFFYT